MSLSLFYCTQQIFFPYSRFKEFPSIKNLFPRASIKFIPDSGHWPHAEKPMEFAQIVTDFLDNCLQDHD